MVLHKLNQIVQNQEFRGNYNFDKLQKVKKDSNRRS